MEAPDPVTTPADGAAGPAAWGAPCEPEDAVELVVIGAGPQALTLMLRLLEEDPDLLEEGVRATLSMDDHVR